MIEWTEAYKARARSNHWKNYLEPSKRSSPAWLDLDDELQALIRKAKRFQADCDKALFHKALLARLQKLSSDYRIGEGLEYDDEVTRKRRTVFDESVKRQTMRATKFSKLHGDIR